MTANSKDAASALSAFVSEEPFPGALLRARERFRQPRLGAPPIAGLQQPQRPTRRPESSRPLFLVGEREHRLYPLDPQRIDYIESDGNYVRYRTGSVEYIARETGKRLEQLLSPMGFLRIERSLLVNIRAIAYVEPIGHGAFEFTLTSGVRLRSGRTYRESIVATFSLRGHHQPMP
jgi:DNA-binding LytR/AlgR family response regulator